jgi:hypothetical protein
MHNMHNMHIMYIMPVHNMHIIYDSQPITEKIKLSNEYTLAQNAKKFTNRYANEYVPYAQHVCSKICTNMQNGMHSIDEITCTIWTNFA